MYKSLWERIVNGVDGARICLGIDPHLSLMEEWIEENPEVFLGLDAILSEAMALDNNENMDPSKADIDKLSVREKLLNPEYAGYASAIFSGLVIDSFDPDNVVAIKPQSAFFEQFGSKGLIALESVISVAKMREIPVILDVKRGDIGSTMTGYANAYLSDDSPLSVDAITVSPFLGLETIRLIADYANENHRGIFVLCLTSNEGAADFQLAKSGKKNETIAKQIYDFALDYNAKNGTTIGLVVGATVKDAAKKAGIDFANFNGPILCPGVGEQGGNGADIRAIFGREGKYKVLPSLSRQILKQGPDVQNLMKAAEEATRNLYDTVHIDDEEQDLEHSLAKPAKTAAAAAKSRKKASK